MAKSETLLVTSILKTLRADGGFWIKLHGSPMQTSGLPDIVGCYKGYFVGFEVKRPGFENTTTSRQEWILGKIKENGGISAVVTDANEALRVLWNKGVEDATKAIKEQEEE